MTSIRELVQQTAKFYLSCLSAAEAIRRYAYTGVYRATLDYFTRAWSDLGFTVTEDPVGNLVARNRPPGRPVFGIGSHCDSNRNGGKWDGTLGVVCALEVCRLNAELGVDLPLQAISFLEEEGSGFAQMLLGSRIVAQRVDEQDLRERDGASVHTSSTISAAGSSFTSSRPAYCRTPAGA